MPSRAPDKWFAAAYRAWPLTWVGVAGFEPAVSSSRTTQARVQVGWSEVSILLRALQAARLTASKRTGPRAVAPISLPESDTPASRRGTESASGLPRARPCGTARSMRRTSAFQVERMRSSGLNVRE